MEHLLVYTCGDDVYRNSFSQNEINEFLKKEKDITEYVILGREDDHIVVLEQHGLSILEREDCLLIGNKVPRWCYCAMVYVKKEVEVYENDEFSYISADLYFSVKHQQVGYWDYKGNFHPVDYDIDMTD